MRRLLLSLCGLTCSLFVTSILADDVEKPIRYTIQRTKSKITIDGKLNEADWKAAKSVGKFQFPWYDEGKKEQTAAKLLWDVKYLYVSYRCEDVHIWGKHTQRDSKVYLDDCVEVFTAPNPNHPNNYFNFEINVRKAILDQHHPNGPGVKVKEEWNATGVKIAVTINGTLNDDSDTDKEWILEAAIPFANFAKVAKHAPPKNGDVWHLNLNRLGGKTNNQYSQWSPGKSPRPDYHTPNTFGRVIFSK
jgi:hypothetical protein